MKSIKKKTVKKSIPARSVKKVDKKSAAPKVPVKNEVAQFPIVAIGASAGGLEAFKLFLSALPADTGSAFVLIMHLDPKHKSITSEILSRLTSMPVMDGEDAQVVEPNHIYVIPSDAGMGILHGKLILIQREEHTNQRLIDYFFRSLADDRKDLAVGVILSGSGSDGSEGIQAIKAQGGMTFAQTPNTAKFDEMPKNAIATGAIDRTLPPDAIAKELAHHNTYFPVLIKDLEEKSKKSVNKGNLDQIYLQLRNVCHVDFTYYKSNTFKRRLARQMALHRINDIDSYAKFLSQNPDAVKALYADILIHVTRFFRDPEAYEALVRDVFPQIMKNRPSGAPIRIWIPGCSTGEEVYSIAIALLEFLGDQVASTPVQIFASDISETVIQKARIGEYPQSISKDVSPDRLNRFFTKLDNGCYKISKSIRDICLFSRHDITVDAPFARMDLISCRNLLIYLTSELQAHIIPIFHYSLKPNGYLWLGVSETVGGLTNLFSLIDKTNKTYVKKNAQVSLKLHFPPSTYIPSKTDSMGKEITLEKSANNFPALADQALQAEYPGVLINGDLEILEFRGRTVPFIEPVPGMASFNLLKMARKEIKNELNMLIQKAKRENRTVKKDGLILPDGKRNIQFNVRIIPIESHSAAKEKFFFIHFENAIETVVTKKAIIPKGKKKTGKKSTRTDQELYIVELQEELNASQLYQRSLIDKYENTQENLTSANEELQSANEELQSANEEMETAKEELQSTNEELTTVNDELQSRSLEQVQLSNDLINLLGSIEIPILMLGNDFHIRRFTPLAGKILNLLATDVGRPISDLKLNFTSADSKFDLDKLVLEVLETMTLKEMEIQDRNGRWFRLQVRPYKTIDNRIDGVVLALVDIHGLKESLDEVIHARAEAENANRGKDIFLATLSHELRTPLTSILSWAQMIRMGRLDAEKTKKGIAIIEESGKAQAQLINDLLDVSRIVAGKLTLELCEMNPIASILAAIEMVKPLAAKKSIKIEMNLAPDVGTVLGDPVRLQQIFWNLLTNAIKFSNPNSTIDVKLERTMEDHVAHATIHICDTGKGVDAKFIPHLFDRFSQQDSSSVRTHGGLGLGLAIVKNLVELHDGKITVESSGKVPGATFSVYLPIKSDSELPVQPLSLETQEEIHLEGIKVLIVDDEYNTREAFNELLQAAGAICLTADSVPDALEKTLSFRPKVIVSDIAMPMEDGYSFVNKLRSMKDKELRDIPAIAVTAYAGREEIKSMLAAGFNAHLAKPIDAHDLVRNVCELMKKK